MGGVKFSPDDSSPGHRLLDPVLVGTIFGILSAIGYTAANICLRAVATEHDPFWVSCLKPVPTILFAAPVVLWQASRGVRCWMSHRALIALAVSGIFAQLAGNVAFQWALGIVGMAICVPVTLGTLMIGGAVLGRFWLGEAVTGRSAFAMLLLTVSIVVLAVGSAAAYQSVQAEDVGAISRTLLGLAVGAAALAGLAYAVLGVVIRRAVTGSATLSATLLVVSLCGIASLVPFALVRVGLEGMMATSAGDLSTMLMAGVFNAFAFFALSKGLKLISVVRFNLINASQTAMAAVAGLLIFQEALTMALIVGVGLTVGGLLLIDERKRPAAAHGNESPQPHPKVGRQPAASRRLPEDHSAAEPTASSYPGESAPS